jgi:sodium/pantothenate symporter
MLVGASCYTLLASLNIEWWGFHPIVPSLTLSLLAFLVGNLFGRTPETHAAALE